MSLCRSLSCFSVSACSRGDGLGEATGERGEMSISPDDTDSVSGEVFVSRGEADGECIGVFVSRGEADNERGVSNGRGEISISRGDELVEEARSGEGPTCV